MTKIQPFTHTHYTLKSCELCTLAPPAVTLLSQHLSQMSPWNVLSYTADQLSTYLLSTDPGLYKYQIMVEKQVVGIVCIRYPWLRGAYLELIAIYPQWQQQGIGPQIICWFEQELNYATLKNLWVLVSSFNEKAKLFYQRAGFKEIGPVEDLVKIGYTEILLRKMLK